MLIITIELKSRSYYDTPGLMIAHLAHIDLEGLVLDSKVRILRDRNVTTEWSQCLYNGRFSETSNLYSKTEASIDSLEGFSPEATSGFLTIQAIWLEKYGATKIKEGEPLV
ncbi:putative argininosuccinate synthase protein [Eutypa lata UCREL1]|uniref:argininosuccinate synthase n=1 Tax=Eutypa lata (strain UCR-EL1) TaxID=1287681 RepID=M7SC98_EUTLA|nr:putative argininosuccinate synthase protein [Eutypa lata UCREL1]